MIAEMMSPSEGILLLDKSRGHTSFHLVRLLRRRLNIQKIGHAGTLDPFATGLMVMLVSRSYTRLSDHFLGSDKEYLASLTLGKTTDTYDCDGETLSYSDLIPSLEEIQNALIPFQGETLQVPPMYSAKKQGGKKLCDLARQGTVVERAPVPVKMEIQLLDYTYPHLELKVMCSKGTYIRSLAHDLGQSLGCGAFLHALRRTRSGSFSLDHAFPDTYIIDPSFPIHSHLLINASFEKQKACKDI